MSCPLKSRQFKWFILPAGLLASVNACFAKISSTVFHVSCEIFCKCLDKDKEDKNGRFLRQERYAGSCSRSFYVGDVKPEEIHAKYESGVLTVLVPKEDIKKSPVGTAITIE